MKHAGKNNTAVSIGRDEYYKLMEGATCFYCSDKITLTTGYCLDRIDGSQGYEITNVVVCCKHCNRLKSETFSAVETKKLVAALKEIRGTGEASPWIKNKNDSFMGAGRPTRKRRE